MYVFNKAWSGTLQRRAHHGSLTVHDHIVEKISSHFGNDKFLWVANTNHSDSLFAANANAQRLPNVSHGLNTYQDYTDVAYLSALNPSPAEVKYFNILGFTGEQVRISRLYESAYQSAMRCSLRSQGGYRPVTIIVMDKSTALHLHNLLPGSDLQKLDWFPDDMVQMKSPGRSKKYNNDSERLRAFRARKKAVALHHKFVDSFASDEGISNYGTMCNDIPLESYSNNVANEFHGSQFSSTKAAIANYIYMEKSQADFIAKLEFFSSKMVHSKEDNSLISPALFDPDKSPATKRGIANIEFLRGIWLDNDGDGIPPEDIPAVFPDLELVIFNSFNSTEAKPRYRVYIPTTTIFSVETHNTIINEIWERLDKAVRPETGQFHGFDKLKKPASSLFYLPCQAADPQGCFFEKHLGNRRKPLDPEEWVRKFDAPVQNIGAPVTPVATPSIDPAVIAARMWWRNLPHKPGSGNSNFYELGLRLRSAGLDDRAIANELKQEALYARSPDERRKQIPSILSSLKSRQSGGSSGGKAA